MHARVFFACFFAVVAVQPTLAADNRTVIWDQYVAAAASEALTRDSTCLGAPSERFDRSCADRRLNHRHSNYIAVTLLDELAVTFDRYKNLIIDEQVARNTRIKFVGKSSNVLNEEVEAYLYLMIRW